MSVPESKAIVKAATMETEQVKVVDVFESDKKKEFTKKNGEKGEILLPYRIRIEDSKGEIVSEEESTAALYTNKWLKKFYKGKTDYWNYTRNETLIAILEILRAKKHNLIDEIKEKGELNINHLRGVTFDAVLSKYENRKFINWVQTFFVNGVQVPEQEDNTPQVEKALAEHDPYDLPFN